MKALLIVVLLALAAPGPPQPAPQYFTNVRDVSVMAPDRQNYFVVDAELWAHARPDLADLRIYSDKQEIPYAMVAERGSSRVREHDGRIINLGTGGGTTQFVIDVMGAGEYNRVALDLEGKDFITRATVDGLDQLTAAPGVRLGTFTLYDFSREQLGTNKTMKLPDSQFPYLRVTLPGLAPDQVKGATVKYREDTRTVWMHMPVTPRILHSGQRTVIIWESPPNLPLDRVAFQVSPGNVNFRRPVTVSDAGGRQLARGELSRIHIQRGGKVVDSEELSVDVSDARSANFTVTVDNGDDPPLAVTTVQPLSVERRVYFDPRGRTTLRLYYGDDVLGAPTYDYAKLFQQDPQAVTAQLGPGAHNAVYVGRPDERPWTERHPAVLWTVLVLAVVGLGAVALRGLRTA